MDAIDGNHIVSSNSALLGTSGLGNEANGVSLDILISLLDLARLDLLVLLLGFSLDNLLTLLVALLRFDLNGFLFHIVLAVVMLLAFAAAERNSSVS